MGIGSFCPDNLEVKIKMLHTTFRLAKEANPEPACKTSYKKFAKHVGGVKKFGQDTPIPLTEILDVCGFQDAIWCLKCTIENSDRFCRLYILECAEHVLPIFEEAFPNNKRPRRTIKILRKEMDGEATSKELAYARDNHWVGIELGVRGFVAKDAPHFAFWAACWALTLFTYNDESGEQTGDEGISLQFTIYFAARAAVQAAGADRDAMAAAGNAEMEWQSQKFKEMLNCATTN